jgi:release factor glutamine methyltransferase
VLLAQAKTVQEILAVAAQRLAAAGCDTPSLDAELLLAHTLEKDRTWLYTYPQHPLEPATHKHFSTLLNRREQREPVAYITGSKAFFGLDFQVNRHVLIPRPETELLIETVLALARPGTALTIADVGTGSGCIAVTLAKHLAQAQVFALDISEPALALARENAVRHGVAAKITFLRGNLLEPLPQPVDLIVSNPPYLSHSELPTLSPEISRYEPEVALVTGQDGLAVIRQLLPQAGQKLNPGGTVLMEIGAGQGEAVKTMAKNHFPQAAVQIKQDLAGRDRLLVVFTNDRNV